MRIRVQLEPTTYCNSHCLFCPRDAVIESGVRSATNIDWDFLKLTLDRMAESPYDFEWISLSGLGEPLLYPRIVEMIRLIKHTFPAVHLKMNTNAAVLRDGLANALVESGLDQLICSLNTADGDTFERYKGLSYDSVRDNILSFLRDKREHKPAVFIRINAFDNNLSHIAEANRFWLRRLNRNDRFSLGRFSNWAGKIERGEFVEHKLTGERYPCKYLDGRNLVAITLDGDVFPCCSAVAESRDSALFLGNIAEDKLESIYQSEKMAGLLEQHRAGGYPAPCDKCDTWGEQVENIDEFRSVLRSVPRKSAGRRLIAWLKS